MGAKGKKNMTDKDFKIIKALLNAGASTSIIRQATGRSPQVVSTVRDSGDFKDYKRLTTKRYEARVVKRQTSAEDGTTYSQPVATHIPQHEVKPVNKYEAKVLDKLDRIAEATEALLRIEQTRHDSEKAQGWRFGKSR
jgi:hypothetical protein